MPGSLRPIRFVSESSLFFWKKSAYLSFFVTVLFAKATIEDKDFLFLRHCKLCRSML